MHLRLLMYVDDGMYIGCEACRHVFFIADRPATTTRRTIITPASGE